jgi:hypothetical protein
MVHKIYNTTSSLKFLVVSINTSVKKTERIPAHCAFCRIGGEVKRTPLDGYASYACNHLSTYEEFISIYGYF